MTRRRKSVRRKSLRKSRRRRGGANQAEDKLQPRIVTLFPSYSSSEDEYGKRVRSFLYVLELLEGHIIRVHETYLKYADESKTKGRREYASVLMSDIKEGVPLVKQLQDSAISLFSKESKISKEDIENLHEIYTSCGAYLVSFAEKYNPPTISRNGPYSTGLVLSPYTSYSDGRLWRENAKKKLEERFTKYSVPIIEALQ